MKRLRAAWGWLSGQVSGRDLYVFGGLALLGTGAGMAYPPAGPMVVGLVLLLIGVKGLPEFKKEGVNGSDQRG